MKFVIETARDQHLVKDEATLRGRHAKFIAKLAAAGRRVQVHDSMEPKAAEINHGGWAFTCECGAGVAADPTFSAGYCFGCGAIHTSVVFPDDEERANIERLLLSRTKTENRNWSPGEHVDQLQSDNDDHGVKR